VYIRTYIVTYTINTQTFCKNYFFGLKAQEIKFIAGKGTKLLARTPPLGVSHRINGMEFFPRLRDLKNKIKYNNNTIIMRTED